MTTREEFGSYLLLKKLSEDPLGETFRAGKVEAQSVGQVVLLRVFNGRNVDGERLWQKISNRASIQQALKSTNIGNGADLGRVRGVPYVAYDYISGKNLASLMERASRQHSPIPTDHALLISERIALGLAVAYETRYQDDRILHGFLVPQLIMISNEGETRLLGFEVAPGLRELAASGAAGQDFARYLSPETLSGAALSKSDDVYSLGATLFELLTGRILPSPSASGYGAIIDQATLGVDGGPLPAEVAGLLKRSLAPREQRISDVVTWHKSLGKLMIEGQYSPTTFNLAFFMHNLFRDEIERESQELEAEKTIELPPPAPPTAVAAPLPAPHGVSADTGGVHEDTHAVLQRYGFEEGTAKGSKSGLWIGIAAAVLVAAGIAGYFIWGRFGGAGTAPAQSGGEPAATAPAQAAAPPPAVQSGPSPDELKAQLDQMLSEKTAVMEANLKAQYDERIKGLQKQLEETQKAAERETQRRAAASEAAEPPVKKTSEPPSTGEVAHPTLPATDALAVKPAAPGAATGSDHQDPAHPASPPLQQAATVPPATQQPPAPANPAPAPPPPPKEPEVRLGDLVTLGQGVIPPRLTRQPSPRYPPVAKQMNRSASVVVKVLVDENGRVQKSDLAGEKAGFGFDEAALEAAREATFQPATKNGVRVKMWTTIKLDFRP